MKRSFCICVCLVFFVGSFVFADEDFGDAPEGGGCVYPVTLPFGARHTIVPGVKLGWKIDAELNGQPSLGAVDDNLTGLNDDDGIHFITPWTIWPTPATASIIALADCNGFLEGWVDFNADGIWQTDPNEYVISAPTTKGYKIFTFNIPSDAMFLQGLYCRFRFNTSGPIYNPGGPADDGEVEDYQIFIRESTNPTGDLGDASDSEFPPIMNAYPGSIPVIPAAFPTIYQPGEYPATGPKHNHPYEKVYLGDRATIEENADGVYDQDVLGPGNCITNISPFADLSDMDFADDSLVELPILPQCGFTTVDFKLTTGKHPPTGCYVNIWFDWNRDGDWDDVIEDCNGLLINEWAVQEMEIACERESFKQVVYRTPPFRCFHPQDAPKEIWMRITVSQGKWDGGPNFGIRGNGGGWDINHMYGETEDYYFVPDTKCPNCGDFDDSGSVNFVDFAQFAQLWLTLTDYSLERPNGDFDCDGFIGMLDLAIIAGNWLNACE